MKKNFKTILFCLFLGVTLHGQEDKQIIIDLLATETKAWADADYETWKASWVHSPMTQMSYTQPGSSKIMEGWDAIHKFFKPYFDSGEKRALTSKMEDIKIDIGGDLAFVSFREVESYLGFSTNKKKSIRVVKKTADGWKILASNVLFENALD